jgi:hypothetical protein
MHFQLVKKSSNAKIGPIPATNSPRATCPPACPLSGKGGCYAEAGFHTRLNWDAIDAGKRGAPWPEFIKQIEALPPGTLWRHNVSGDLPPIAPDEIKECSVVDLVNANRGKRGFTYTHYPMTRQNARIVRAANNSGFTINASANNIGEAVKYHRRGLPTVTIVSDSAHGKDWRKITRSGVDVVQCPAEYRDDVTCKTCALCSRSKRSTIVGFTVHGTRAKSADLIARG